jgi:hypothetical protein
MQQCAKVTFRNSSQRLAKISASANEWNFKVILVDMVLFVRHRQNFALINVVDFDGF